MNPLLRADADAKLAGLAPQVRRGPPIAVPTSGEGLQASSRAHAQPTVSCVVPCFNEAESLALFLPMLANTLAGCAPAWEVILVDDGSTDATPLVLAAWSQRAGFRVLHQNIRYRKPF